MIRSRVHALFLSTLLCAGLAACGQDAPPTNDEFRAAIKPQLNNVNQAKIQDYSIGPKGCVKDDTGYSCEETNAGQVQGERPHLHKTSDGWVQDVNN